MHTWLDSCCCLIPLSVANFKMCLCSCWLLKANEPMIQFVAWEWLPGTHLMTSLRLPSIARGWRRGCFVWQVAARPRATAVGDPAPPSRKAEESQAWFLKLIGCCLLLMFGLIDPINCALTTVNLFVITYFQTERGRERERDRALRKTTRQHLVVITIKKKPSVSWATAQHQFWSTDTHPFDRVWCLKSILISQICHMIQKQVKKYPTPSADCSCYILLWYLSLPTSTMDPENDTCWKKTSLPTSRQAGSVFVGEMLSDVILAEQWFEVWSTTLFDLNPPKCGTSTIWVPSCYCWLAPCRPGKRDSPGPKEGWGRWVLPLDFMDFWARTFPTIVRM